MNYVIACWSGDRRRKDSALKRDPAYYLRTQIQYLEKYQHELSQITVVVPRNPKEPARFRQYLDELAQQPDIQIVERNNFGQSYGSYERVFDLYRDAFDYYIFMEDDWVFVQDNFDRKMIELFKAKPGCGYLCGLAAAYEGRLIASISNGITSCSVLQRIWDEFGNIPHGSTRKSRYSVMPQVDFSRAFVRIGSTINDIIEDTEYVIPYDRMGKLEVFTRTGTCDGRLSAMPAGKQVLMVPIQQLEGAGPF